MLKVPNKYRALTGPFASTEEDGNNGAFDVPYAPSGKSFSVIASDGMGWEHVSVSYPNRCPTWEEMCFIKELFWEPEDVVIQYHPRESEYVNQHPYCLHLWRSTDQVVPTPPPIMVGY
jgi:hypothetical protein